MKLLAELTAGVAAFGIAWFLARPHPQPATASPSVTIVGAGSAQAATPRADASLLAPTNAAVHVVATTDASGGNGVEAEPNRIEMDTLRNAVLAASGHPNGVMDCLRGVELASAMRLRFAIEVDATAHDATTGAWRFVEVVDGQQLPDTFAACAERAMGGNLRVAAPPGLTFPAFRGELTTLYRTPEPSPAAFGSAR